MIFRRGDDELRQVLRVANELAISQAASNRESPGSAWDYIGFQGPRVWMFIREGNILEHWQEVVSQS